MTSSVSKRRVAEKRSHVSNIDAVANESVGSLSATADRSLKLTDVRRSNSNSRSIDNESIDMKSNCSHVTSTTADRDADLGQCDRTQPLCETKDKKLPSDNGLTTPSCCQQQRSEKSEITNITDDTSDGPLQKSPVSIADIADTREAISLQSNVARFEHSRFVNGTFSLPEDSVSTVSGEILADRQEITQEEKSTNHINNSNDNISITRALLRSSEVGTYGGQDMVTGKVSKKTLSPFDELAIERDFECMDEILSCMTPEPNRFFRSSECHYSDGPDIRSSSTPAGTLVGKSLEPNGDAQQWYCPSETNGDSSVEVHCPKFCPYSFAAEVRPVRDAATELLYNVHSVMSAPVIEVASSLRQEYCLSSPQSTDYVAENCHKVNEVSAEHHRHRHHHLAGPGRCEEDPVVDCSPCSDDVVVGSSDTSTVCSLSSPSGSQLSQDSCRCRSPDDSTLVGDLELFFSFFFSGVPRDGVLPCRRHVAMQSVRSPAFLQAPEQLCSTKTVPRWSQFPVGAATPRSCARRRSGTV